MAINTKGTEIWFYDEEKSEVVKVGCPTGLGGLGGARDQNEVTPCLDSEEKEFLPGMITPGQGDLAINYDPAVVSHTRMHELYRQGKVLKFVIGLAGDKTAPTHAGADWTLATSRHWLKFTGYFSDYSFDFALGGVVSATIPVQLSTGLVPVPATA